MLGATLGILAVIGMETLDKLVVRTIRNVSLTRKKAMQSLMESIEAGTNKERYDFIKFKVCKCRKVRYCTKKCQKRHWKKRHRCNCDKIELH